MVALDSFVGKRALVALGVFFVVGTSTLFFVGDAGGEGFAWRAGVRQREVAWHGRVPEESRSRTPPVEEHPKGSKDQWKSRSTSGLKLGRSNYGCPGWEGLHTAQTAGSTRSFVRVLFRVEGVLCSRDSSLFSLLAGVLAPIPPIG